MTEITLEFSTGEELIVDFPKLLPFVIGQKMRKTIRFSVETKNGSSGTATMDNGMDILNGCQEIVFEELIKPRISEEQQATLSVESCDKVVELYWNQVQGIIKKKVQHQESIEK